MKHICTGVLSVSLLLLVRSSIALSFEHSFDGVKFTDAGSLMGDMYKVRTGVIIHSSHTIQLPGLKYGFWFSLVVVVLTQTS